MKPFKTLSEQIDILRERELIITDEEKTANYILHNNYYNLINCYSKYFFEKKDLYQQGTTFDHIVAVHHFDKNLKSTLFKFIIDAEKTFKSIFAYRYSEFYRDIPFPYLDINHYEDKQKLNASKNISQLSNIILKQARNRDNSISHYVSEHHDVPMWVLVNNLTFGQTSKLYSFMTMSLRNTISKDHSYFLKENCNNQAAILQADQLESYLINMVELRNIIAHNNKVIDYKCIKNNRFNPYLHAPYNIGQRAPRNDVYNAFLTMQCFLTPNEFTQLNNAIVKRFNKLRRHIDLNAYKKICDDLGFPEQLPKLQQ